MSRSGYNDDDSEGNEIYLWRGAVASAIKGKRGQAFLEEMIRALDALPEKRLIKNDLEEEGGGEVCAIGAVGKARNIDMRDIDSHDPGQVAAAFGIARAMAAEIEWMNDELLWRETPEERHAKMRAWAEGNLLSKI